MVKNLSRDNILWLVSWYPSAVSSFDGDFIQRHAKAASILHNITVIFVKKDSEGLVTKNKKTVINKSGNLSETIIYYYSPKTGISIVDRIISRMKHNRICKAALKKHLADNGLPALVHVHVALHVAPIALWLHKKYGLALLVSEHWTGYLKNAKPNIENYHPVYKKWIQQLFNKAYAITTVSKVLCDAIRETFDIPTCHVIPNVVDTSIFFPVVKSKSSSTRFIHVSLLNYQKNPAEIIEAFSMVKKAGYDFTLSVYGPAPGDLLQLVRARGLEKEISFLDEVPQKVLAEDMQQSDALVLYSRYETFGCVVIEANACGLPAILSDLPVFREYIVENKTGIFAKPCDPQSLAETIIRFMKDKDHFIKEEIASHTKNTFGFDVIAKQFDDLYKAVVIKP